MTTVELNIALWIANVRRDEKAAFVLGKAAAGLLVGEQPTRLLLDRHVADAVYASGGVWDAGLSAPPGLLVIFALDTKLTTT